MATRQCSMKTIESLTDILPNLIGGSADLSGSNNTMTSKSKVIKAKNFGGNYIHYGVREHGMAAAMNGLALYHNIIPFGGTFLIFSDYCRPSIETLSFDGIRVIYIFFHDSIGLGEDGPTHQPIEQLTSLRAIPNLNVFRPADMNETLECWEMALKNDKGPSAIILSRQKLPYINQNFSEINNCSKGGYQLKISSHASNITLIASGSEVSLALEVQKDLKDLNIDSSVVSMPCQEIFDKQDKEYRDKVLENDSLKISIEAGNCISWKKYMSEKDLSISIETFGKSAPYKKLFEDYKLTSQEIIQLIQQKIRK